jgi:hypothetical protein
MSETNLMIVFITSVRHPRNSNSYDDVLALLANTLRSVCNQQHDAFRVLVVCNEIPRLSYEHPHITYVKVDFPPPSEMNHACIGMDALRLDRGCKYLIGLIHARQFNPDYVMFFDADDYVSNRIVGFVSQHPGRDGWFLPEGYVYDQDLSIFGRLRNFHMICGTSHIVRYSSYEIPPDLPPDADQSYILDRIDHHYLFKVIGSHRWLADHMAEKGRPLEPLPFTGALYLIGNGQNHTSRVISCALWAGAADDLEMMTDEPETLDISEVEKIREEFTFLELAGGEG